MKRPEQILHMAVARYLDLALRPPTFFTTFPAGGGGKLRGAMLKKMGLKPGVADLVVYHPGIARFSPGLGRFTQVIFIELKAAKGKMSPEQKDFAAACEAFGATYLLCRSVDDVEIMLGACGIPLHARNLGKKS